MGHFYFLLALGAWVLLAFLFSLHRRFGRHRRLPYVADDALFSPEQRTFLVVLERAVGRGYRIYGRVRATDVIGLRRRPRLDRGARRRALTRIWARQFDFLVCRADSSAIVCAVNLAPRSRLRRGPPRDSLDRICAAAGLPFVRFREDDSYSAEAIREGVFGAIRALRPAAAKVAEPPPRPAKAADREMIHSLSDVVVDDHREPRFESIQVPHPAAERPSRRATAVPPEATAGSIPRIEPTLVGEGEMDLGPKFSIESDLEEDDRPIRRRL